MTKQTTTNKHRRTYIDFEQVGIYKITSPTNKVYIGQSWDIGQRWNSYSRLKCKSQHKIYNSLLKYGSDNHIFKIIQELPIDTTQDVLNNYEILYWELYKDCNIEMMNLREPTSRGKLSDESRLKMKNARIGIALSESHKKSISIANKGRKKPIGFGEKLSLAKQGYRCSEETKIKISKTLTGKKGTPMSEKNKEALRNYQLGRKLTKETIEKRTATRKINRLLKNKNQ
jgi:group I intron endonuclease